MTQTAAKGTGFGAGSALGAGVGSLTAAAITGANTQQFTFTGGALKGTATVNLNAANADTVANLAASFQEQLNANAGFNAYSVTATSGTTIAIASNVYAGPVTVASVTDNGTGTVAGQGVDSGTVHTPPVS